jgi:hypothetical protein
VVNYPFVIYQKPTKEKNNNIWLACKHVHTQVGITIKPVCAQTVYAKWHTHTSVYRSKNSIQLQIYKCTAQVGCDLICSRCNVVFYHVRVLTVIFLLNNLIVKFMKWYILSHKSPNRRSLCIYPGL